MTEFCSWVRSSWVRHPVDRTDKARAGTRLAAISLLDDKPDQALEAIKTSEVPDMPPDLVAQRRRLMGRALFETGDTLKGMALIRDDNSLDGLWLKADLSWRLREWPAAAAAPRCAASCAST